VSLPKEKFSRVFEVLHPIVTTIRIRIKKMMFCLFMSIKKKK